jgi:TonB family protein
MDAVTQIVAVRKQEADGLQSMLTASGLAHLVLIAVVFLAPSTWFGSRTADEPENIMTISLSGNPGPRAGGMTTSGGRPIQEAVPIDAKKVIEPIRPPAAREPEMIEPKKTAPKKAEAKVPNEAKDPRSRTPTKGEEVRKGSAPSAESTARGQGFGLSSGGGGTGSYLDTANFCCPDYIVTMLELIRRNWDYRQQAAGSNTVKFTIERDGTLTAVQVEKPSGYPALDLLSHRAVVLTKKLPPLPGAFAEPALPVHLVFEYQRQ